MKLQIRASLALSIIALVVSIAAGAVGGAIASGVLIGSKQIKNGSVKSIDLKNNNVGSADLRNNGVASADLAPNSVESEAIAPASVESEALALPGPVQCQVTGSTKINPTTAFSKVADVCTYTKETAESVLEVNWTGSAEGHNGGEVSGCVFQLRVNGAPSAQGGGEAFVKGLSSVSDSALFSGLAAGPVTVEVWARLAAQEPGMGGDFDACTVGPPAASTNQTIDVAEAVV